MGDSMSESPISEPAGDALVPASPVERAIDREVRMRLSPCSRSVGVFSALVLAFTLLPPSARAVTVTLSPTKDNTLYESATGAVSNGAGEYLFAGSTDRGLIRRALIQFEVAGALPAGSTINSVTLRLNVSRTRQNTQRTTSVHRVLADWGEGASNADQNEGQGASADTNDATWIHRSRYPDVLWASAGGDFTPLASATAPVGGNASYSWSGTELNADVQDWLDNPSTNFGWLIRGDESASQTAKRFDSSENGTVTRRPTLEIDFTPPGGGATGACCYADTCDVLTAAVCASVGGTYQGDGTVCEPDPCRPALRSRGLDSPRLDHHRGDADPVQRGGSDERSRCDGASSGLRVGRRDFRRLRNRNGRRVRDCGRRDLDPPHVPGNPLDHSGRRLHRHLERPRQCHRDRLLLLELPPARGGRAGLGGRAGRKLRMVGPRPRIGRIRSLGEAFRES
jgi:hypothetical protein